MHTDLLLRIQVRPIILLVIESYSIITITVKWLLAYSHQLFFLLYTIFFNLYHSKINRFLDIDMLRYKYLFSKEGMCKQVLDV